MPIATFAAGCFWGVEEYFRKLKGVKSTRVGYTGGKLKNPSYEDVSTGSTGHAESIEIQFDDKIIPYRDLVKKFFQMHGPTTLNRQGPDIGSQYRSAIFYHSPEQKEISEQVKSEINKELNGKVVTEIVKAGPFHEAEEYHQKYLQKQGLKVCH